MVSSLPELSLDGDAGSVSNSLEEEAGSQVPDPQTGQVPETRSGPTADLVPVSPDLGPLPTPDLPSPTGLERALIVVRHGVRQATGTFHAASSRPGGPGSVQPESWAQYRARVRARGWVPEEYRKTWLGWVPAVHYATVGNAGWAMGNGVVWLATHMLAFYVAFLLTGTSLILWFCFN